MNITTQIKLSLAVALVTAWTATQVVADTVVWSGLGSNAKWSTTNNWGNRSRVIVAAVIMRSKSYSTRLYS